MSVRRFVDTNIVVYAEAADADKTRIAKAIIESGPTISTQVVNETVAVLTRKHGFTQADAHEVASALLQLCEIVPVSAQTVETAISLCRRHTFSHWDALIVASALYAGCDELVSEDMQAGMLINDTLRIVNPFA